MDPLATLSRVVRDRHGPPGASRQLVGQSLGMHDGHHGLGLAQQQQPIETAGACLSHARPASEVDRIATGRVEHMGGQQLADRTQVMTVAPGRAQRHLGLAALRQRVHDHRGLVDPDGLKLLRQQHVQPQTVLVRELHQFS
jgi:NAD(P)H-hydrate repair Nnr-like enzyme with NAD(P)H-hydrate dehydratase domain